jgi:UDPglucose--hexose-1-phosphate uridylyltransferase
VRRVLNGSPYNFILHTPPRLTQIAGFEWGTGFYLNPTSPEEAASLLREADLR